MDPACQAREVGIGTLLVATICGGIAARADLERLVEATAPGFLG